ncbi:hypothetical protein HII31_02310 [Pseudocercospora fuligena]|uniref:BTB domain-containing protein n=1 Tax=Pseudocercospora fuligena TaxID=685502 RepID=A0A8H6VKY1_9PEZI|nr:hypothetical protein HII31_02310 [Pseudocercospora fuligena]
MASPEQALKNGLASFKVHKVIICAQSEYFRAACHNFKEAEKNAIDLATSDTDPTCDDPEAVRCMVDFFYHLDYQAENIMTSSTSAQAAVDLVPAKRRKGGYRGPSVATPPNTMPQTDGNMLVHARVFAAAVKYQIPALIGIAVVKFAAAVGHNRAHDSFAKTILTVYTTTASDVRQLRDILADTLNKHDELLDSESVAETVRGLEGLSWELFRKSKGKSAVPGTSISSASFDTAPAHRYGSSTGFRTPERKTQYCPRCGAVSTGSNWCFNCADT